MLLYELSFPLSSFIICKENNRSLSLENHYSITLPLGHPSLIYLSPRHSFICFPITLLFRHPRYLAAPSPVTLYPVTSISMSSPVPHLRHLVVSSTYHLPARSCCTLTPLPFPTLHHSTTCQPVLAPLLRHSDFPLLVTKRLGASAAATAAEENLIQSDEEAASQKLKFRG